MRRRAFNRLIESPIQQMSESSAVDRWAAALAEWAIPQHIVDQAPESPWIHPPALFGVPQDIPQTPSHERAREALPEGGTVLDIGCGGGIAVAALVPKVAYAIGVDHQEAMLNLFAASMAERGVATETVHGDWPEVAMRTPSADVVTCHHVVYNVSEITPFVRALTNHAKHRVVVEMPAAHPLSNLRDAWRHFWGIERPTEPGPELFLDVLHNLGISANVEFFESEMRGDLEEDLAVINTRIRLCLNKSRDDEIRDFLHSHPASPTRALATVWWDVDQRG